MIRVLGSILLVCVNYSIGRTSLDGRFSLLPASARMIK